jgi:hypothetical protein
MTQVQEPTWYRTRKRKPSDFSDEEKVSFTFSPNLSAVLRGGVGRAQDRSEAAFSYMKTDWTLKDKSGVDRKYELSLGTLAAALDFAKLLRVADHHQRKIEVRKDRKITVHKGKDGVQVAVYDEANDGSMRCDFAAAVDPKKAVEYAEAIEKMVPLLVATLKQANKDTAPSDFLPNPPEVYK